MSATITVRTAYVGPAATRGSRVRVSWEGRTRLIDFWHGARDEHAHAIGVALHLTDAQVAALEYSTSNNSGTRRAYLVPVPVVVDPSPVTRHLRTVASELDLSYGQLLEDFLNSTKPGDLTDLANACGISEAQAIAIQAHINGA